MKNYNYVFYLRLKFVNPYQQEDFIKHSVYFNKCVNEYNEISEKAANLKHIDVIEFYKTHIDIKLYSNADLNKAPGKALNLLTRLLLDKDKEDCDLFFYNHIYHNKLFVTEMFLPKENNEIISDTEFIKGLIDYISKPKGEITEKERNAMNRIKIIAKECELV